MGQPARPEPDPGHPMEVVAQALVEKGLDHATSAIEERYLGVMYASSIQRRLPGITLVDAEDALWKLRMIKSPEEQRRLRESCVRTGKAWLNSVLAAETGMIQPEMQIVFRRQCLDLGIEYERHAGTDDHVPG